MIYFYPVHFQWQFDSYEGDRWSCDPEASTTPYAVSFICAATDVMLTENCTYRVTVPTGRAISLWGVHIAFASTHSIRFQWLTLSDNVNWPWQALTNMTHCPTEAITTERSLTTVPVYLHVWHDWLCVVVVVLNHQQWATPATRSHLAGQPHECTGGARETTIMNTISVLPLKCTS